MITREQCEKITNRKRREIFTDVVEDEGGILWI